MNNDLLELYGQLEDMPQSKEVQIMKKRVKEKLFRSLKLHFLEYVSIGKVIGYDELKAEMQKAIELINLQQKSEKPKGRAKK